MLFRELMGSPQLLTIEVPAVDQLDRRQPQLGLAAALPDVYVRGLVLLEAEEKGRKPSMMSSVGIVQAYSPAAWDPLPASIVQPVAGVHLLDRRSREVDLDLLLAPNPEHASGVAADLPRRFDQHVAAAGIDVDADPAVAAAVAHHLLAMDDGLGVREAAHDVAATGVGSQLEAGVYR